jgi:hypothetical protein
MTLIAVTPTYLREDRSHFVLDDALAAGALYSAGERITSYDYRMPAVGANTIPVRESMLVICRCRPGCNEQKTKSHPNEISQLAHIMVDSAAFLAALAASALASSLERAQIPPALIRCETANPR